MSNQVACPSLALQRPYNFTINDMNSRLARFYQRCPISGVGEEIEQDDMDVDPIQPDEGK